MAGILFTGLLAFAALANALPQAATGSSCEQLGSGSQQGAYTITCGTDRVGGDLSNGQSSSFSGCIPLCDALAGCVGFTYVKSSGFCYFKSSFAATSTDPNVDVAVKPVSSSSSGSGTAPATSSTRTASSTSAVSTSTSVASTSTSAGATTSTSAAPTSTATGSCDAIGSGSSFGGGYTATCNTDAGGGDLSNAQASSFAACAPLCDALAGCIGFAYANGFCYFKSSQAPLSSNSNVDVAFKPASGSTSSSVSSTAASSSAPSSTAASTTTPATTAPSTSAASTTASSTTASSTRATTSSAVSSSSSVVSSSTSVVSSSSSAVPTTSSTRSSTTAASATSTAAPAPTGAIINPVAPGGNGNTQCTLLRSGPQFRLSTIVTRGNRALNGLFLQVPTFNTLTSPPRLLSGSANGGRFVQTNSNNWFNILPSIAAVTPSGTCTTSGLALYNSITEQGAVGLAANIGTASTVDIATTVSYVFPFQLYAFGSFYACAAPGGGATLQWVKRDASNFFGALYQTLDLTNCALVTLQKTAA